MRRRWIFLGYLLSTLVAGLPTAHAATRIWNGAGADTRWMTPSNWSGSVTPTRSDIAVFNGTSTKTALLLSGTYVGGVSINSGYTGVITLSGASSLAVGSGGFTQAAGTFRGGRGVVMNYGSFALNGGTFVAPTGALGFAGNVSHTSGTFVNSGALAILIGSGQTVTAASAAFQDVSLNDGLIAHWRFDETSGSTYADSSGFGNTLTRTNSPTFSTAAPTTSFSNPGSVQFTSTSTSTAVKDYLVLNPVDSERFKFDRSQDYSASLFIKTAGGTYYHEIISNESAVNRTGWGIMIIGSVDPDNGKIYFHTRTSCCPGAISTSVLNDNRWHHIAAVRRGTTGYLYIDGVLEGTQSNADLNITNAQRLFIGMDRDASFPYTGNVDDVRIYDRALTQAEITQLAAGNVLPVGSAVKTLGAALHLQGNLTISGGTLDVSSSNYPITLSGSWRNAVGRLIPRSGTVTLNGTTQSIQETSDSSFSSLVLTGGTKTLRSAVTVSSLLSVAAGSVLAAPTYALTALIATITNLGTLTQTSGGKIVHSGAVSVSPSTLTIGDSVTVTVTDSDANTNASSAETVTVTADGETFTLTETAVASGIFTGTIPTAHGAQTAGNGVIEHDDSCSFRITPHYRDPEDASDDQSATATVTDPNAACVTGTSGGGGGGGKRGTASSGTSKKSSSSSRPTVSRSSVRSSSSSRSSVRSASSSSHSSVRSRSSSSRKTTTRFRKSVLKRMPG